MVIRKAAVLCGMSAVGMMLAGCGPSNPLIGNWKLGPGGYAGCATELKFSSDQLVSTSPLVGTTTMAVTYNVSPKLVFVMTSGNTVEYNIADSNHMSMSSAWGTCSYSK